MKQGGGTTYYGRKPLDTYFEGERTSGLYQSTNHFKCAKTLFKEISQING